MDKTEIYLKVFHETERALVSAISRRIEHGAHGEILTIDYNARPIYGELARILLDFALECGYEARFGKKARFESSRKYTFEVETIGDHDFIKVVRESPMTFKEVERWCRIHGTKEVRRKRRDGR